MIVNIGKDAIADYAQTAYPAGAPDFEEADVGLVTHTSGIQATASVDLAVEPFDPVGWGLANVPVAIDHIMFNPAIRQFAIQSTVPPDVGSLILLVIRPRGERVKVS